MYPLLTSFGISNYISIRPKPNSNVSRHLHLQQGWIGRWGCTPTHGAEWVFFFIFLNPWGLARARLKTAPTDEVVDVDIVVVVEDIEEVDEEL